MRGFFVRGDGLRLPNNITTYGAERILLASLRNSAPSFYMALCQSVPAQDLLMQQLNEPTLGVGGYARQSISRDLAGWPYLGSLNDEPYLESAPFTFTPTGGGFNKAVNRVAFVTQLSGTTGRTVVALSSAWETPAIFTPSTPENERTFRYQLFLR